MNYLELQSEALAALRDAKNGHTPLEIRAVAAQTAQAAALLALAEAVRALATPSVPNHIQVTVQGRYASSALMIGGSVTLPVPRGTPVRDVLELTPMASNPTHVVAQVLELGALAPGANQTPGNLLPIVRVNGNPVDLDYPLMTDNPSIEVMKPH